MVGWSVFFHGCEQVDDGQGSGWRKWGGKVRVRSIWWARVGVCLTSWAWAGVRGSGEVFYSSGRGLETVIILAH